MIDYEKVAYLKRKIQNYTYYASKHEECRLRLLELNTKRGLHAIKYKDDVVQGSQDPFVKIENDDYIRNQIEKWENIQQSYSNKIKEIDDIIRQMNPRIGEAVRLIYCYRCSTLSKESKKLNISIMTLRRVIDKQLSSIEHDVTL